ncbi:MAG: response regulator [Phycisphaerae bacterium]|nr:response regulator [Phycisphaerae bacterium]
MTEKPAGTVLIVEDDAELRFILIANLRASGFTTLDADDGYEALRIAQERLPDVILMDVGIPELDGIAATRALKNDPVTEHIPVIMLTARSRTEDVIQGLEAGATEYLAKPFDIAELLARVRTVYRLAATRRDLDELNSNLEAEISVKTRHLQILYDFMQSLNRATKREAILDQIIACIRDLTGAGRISLLMRERGTDDLVCERAFGIDWTICNRIRIKVAEGIAGQVFRSGKTLSARSIGGSTSGHTYAAESFLSTPLVSTSMATQEGVIGVINVTDRPGDSPFLAEEIDCIRSIADAAAIALDNFDRRRQLEQSVKVLLRTVGHLAEYRDEETTAHLARVTEMARILALETQRHGPYAGLITDDFIENLVQSAPMHDIGKVGIPDEILTKPGKLTDEEFEIMKTHTEIGRRVLSQAIDPEHPVALLDMCIDIAYCHHERFDGAGYPRGLHGPQIPLAARIIALVDAYDAITSDRRYSAARTHAEAVAVIRQDSGSHFDPVLVESFLRIETDFDQLRASQLDPIVTNR